MDFSKWLNNIYLKEHPEYQLSSEGLGIDLVIKNFCSCKQWTNKNINKSAKLKNLEKQLKREQRCLARKYEDYKKCLRKGEATRQNILKQKLKVQNIYHKLENIRTDYVNKCVSKLVKTKPAYITIENLNVSGMMKNRHLSKAIASQKIYEFRAKLEAKCKSCGIELEWQTESCIIKHL